MDAYKRKEHWERVYSNVAPDRVSWYQPEPLNPLAFVQKFELPFTARIIDVGGGDSFLAERLLEQGYEHITVLDISETAVERARARLGSQAARIKWIVKDILDFVPEERYDLWYDRATFHFFTGTAEIARYVETAKSALHSRGRMIIGTFSEQGSEKCSGIKVRQYSENTLAASFQQGFQKTGCMPLPHQTPSGSVQHFMFCSFQKKYVS